MVEVSPWDPGNPVHNWSPLGKVPVLVLDDGTALYDSRVIVEYIDTVSPVSRLIPEPIRQRIAVQRWERCPTASATLRWPKCSRTGDRRDSGAARGSHASSKRSPPAWLKWPANWVSTHGATGRPTRWRTSRPAAPSAILTCAAPTSIGALNI